ncbi:MAG: hypothetical protein EP330_21690 [Deltaproteobacteria bacterium]|nr:MAG: hypothetical protein EP330_21690 [Deltaproteobacteria bacterium]
MSVEAAAERAVRVYFDELLPRYVDAHFRGAGYGLVQAMLADHDADDVLRLLNNAAPSARALAMARGAEAQVDIRLAVHGPFSGPLKYGEFRRTDTWTSVMGGVDATGHASIFEVVLYADTLGALPSEAVEHEVLFTLFHEMVHYFESFLPEEERPLAERESGREARMTAEEARRRDSWALAKRWGFWVGLAVASLALAFAVAWNQSAPLR